MPCNKIKLIQMYEMYLFIKHTSIFHVLVCCSRAKDLVLSIVNQRNKPEDIIPGANPPYPGPSPAPAPSVLSGHPGFVEIMIPGPKVGLIIGKGGETIKQLQEKSGAKMVVIQEGPGQEQEKPLRLVI